MVPPEPMAAGRTAPTLAQWLGGAGPLQPPDTPADDSANYWAALLAEAEAQQVQGLLLDRLRAVPGVPAHAVSALKAGLMGNALVSMAFDGETRRVLTALGRLNIPALLLKGNALAHWAYANPLHRPCSDVDVLVPSPQDAGRLAAELAGQGYECSQPSGELVAYERMCRRHMGDGWWLEVDIHWRLNNTPLFASVFTFDELAGASVALPALAPNARGLGAVHAMLHAAMHRATNRSNGVEDQLRWLYDFVVLGDRLRPPDWRELEAVAIKKQLAGILADSLRAAGRAFGHAWPEGLLARLEAAMPNEPLDASRLADWRYTQAQTMRALPGWQARARWLWQRLFPSRDYMAYLYGQQGSYAALMWQRLKQAGRKLNRKPGSSARTGG